MVRSRGSRVWNTGFAEVWSEPKEKSNRDAIRFAQDNSALAEEGGMVAEKPALAGIFAYETMRNAGIRKLDGLGRTGGGQARAGSVKSPPPAGLRQQGRAFGPSFGTAEGLP